MTGAIILGIVLLFIGAILWSANMARRAEQTRKTIGELMNEETANADLKVHNDVLRTTPVAGAARRVSDKWTRPE
jgi:hypothetical protein